MQFDYPAQMVLRNLPCILSGEKESEKESDHEHERPTSGDGTIVDMFSVSPIREVGNDLILIPDGEWIEVSAEQRNAYAAVCGALDIGWNGEIRDNKKKR